MEENKLYHDISLLKYLRNLIKECREKENFLKIDILNHFKESRIDEIIDDRGNKIATMKSIKTLSFDVKKFKEENLCAYSDYCVEKESYRLILEDKTITEE